MSKFLDYFAKTNSSFTLTGNRILVEILPKEEMKSQGGIVLATDLKNYKNQMEDARPLLGIIVAVGTSHYNAFSGQLEEGSRYKPGMVAWITKHPVFLSEFPGYGMTDNKLAMITDDPSDIHMVWDSMEAYEQFKQIGK